MPLYEYQCESCRHRFETIQKFSDPPLTLCPKCGAAVRKLQSAPAFQFKGDGWYITDYAKKDAEKRGGEKKDVEKSDGSAGDAKSGASSSAKSGDGKDTSAATSTSSSPASTPAPSPAAGADKASS